MRILKNSLVFLPVNSLSVLLTMCALISALSLAGCLGVENEPDEAVVRLIHENSQLGPVELTSDGVSLLEVSPGTVSDPASLAVGSHQLGVSNIGGMEPFLTTAEINFEAQGYVFALLGTQADPELISFAQTLPVVESGQHALAILDLTDFEEAHTIFNGAEELFQLPVEGRVSQSYIFTGAGENVPLSISLASGGGALAFDSADLPSGGASLIVVSQRADGLSIQLLPL